MAGGPFDYSMSGQMKALWNEGEPIRRFVIRIKANAGSEAGKMPGRRLMEEMGPFNEERVGTEAEKLVGR
jgi:hypothetical protein